MEPSEALLASESPAPEAGGDAPASVAILIQLVILAVSFVLGRVLERVRFQWMGEAGAALLLGLVVGEIIKAAGAGRHLAAEVAFKGDIFFYVLLPTIMFDAGYSLDTRMFIRNVGSVCMYAFAGTTISCFVVGLMMWGFGVAGWCYRMSLLANLSFGALISATDPVTVLAIFQRLNAQPDMYMNVFGESVLNDAVGMVLYKVISSFLDGKAVTAGNVLSGIGLFIGIFLGSTAIGIAVGLLAALIFRSRYFYSGPIVIKQGSQRHSSSSSSGGGGSSAEAVEAGTSTFEVGLAVVFAYGSYLLADAVHFSGIVAVVVNGMVMAMYVKPNLSEEAAHKIETLFRTLAGLFELFVFCYIGTTMFLQEEKFNIFDYTALCLVALAVSRAANILPLTWLVNWLRPVERRIPGKQQFLMWWSGLRGAMAFALSVDAAEKYGLDGKVMKTCTFYLIFITVLINGGTTSVLLQRLKLRAEDTPALVPCRSGDSDQDMAAAEEGGGGGREGEGEGEGGGGGVAPKSGALALPLAVASTPSPTAHRLRTFGHSASASAADADVSVGTRSMPVAAGRPAPPLLERLRTMNDGRLVARFEEFDRKVSKLLIHPDARREAEMTSPGAFRDTLAATTGSLGALPPGSHEAPQSVTPAPSMLDLEAAAGAPAPAVSSRSLAGATEAPTPPAPPALPAPPAPQSLALAVLRGGGGGTAADGGGDPAGPPSRAIAEGRSPLPPSPGAVARGGGIAGQAAQPRRSGSHDSSAGRSGGLRAQAPAAAGDGWLMLPGVPAGLGRGSAGVANGARPNANGTTWH